MDVENTENVTRANGAKVYQKHKDRMFCDLFSQKENAISLFNAINGSDFQDIENFQIITLNNSVYVSRRNDVAYLFHNCIKLFEHQSTVNPNMPLRMFVYSAREYETLYVTDNRDIFSGAMIKIPAPECFVLYNGKKDVADEELKLSNMFTSPSPGYEWTAKVININYGHNKKIMERCKALKGYSFLCNRIRIHREEQKSLGQAVSDAVNETIAEGYLVEYLERNRLEVESMLFKEYTQEERDAAFKEAGREEGSVEKAKDMAISLAKDNVDMDIIARAAKVPVETAKMWLEEAGVGNI